MACEFLWIPLVSSLAFLFGDSESDSGAHLCQLYFTSQWGVTAIMMLIPACCPFAVKTAKFRVYESRTVWKPYYHSTI